MILDEISWCPKKKMSLRLQMSLVSHRKWRTVTSKLKAVPYHYHRQVSKGRVSNANDE